MKKLLICLLLIQRLYPASICLYDKSLSSNNHWPELGDLLRKKGHNYISRGGEFPLKLQKQYDVIIYNNSYPRLKKTAQKSILVTHEPPLIHKWQKNKRIMKNIFRVFSWDHTESSNPKYIPMFYPDYANFAPSKKSFNDRQFACIVNSYNQRYTGNASELYSSRKDIAKFYNKHYPEKLNLYGMRGWNKMNLSVYKGRCGSKSSILHDHKFCYCYENYFNNDHYISEKIIDCIQCECVPIYLGSTNITDYMPKEVFIDARNFSSIQQIHQFLEDMDEETWNGYIKAIRDFKKSEKFKLFNKKHFYKNLERAVLEYLKENNIE